MSDSNTDTESGDEQLPLMQKLLDNPFILLALGVFSPMILYVVWGIIELSQIPLAQ